MKPEAGSGRWGVGKSTLKAALLALGTALAGPVLAAGSVALPFQFKADTGNTASLQRGAGAYMSYCAGCHSMRLMRYNRIGQDLDIPDDLLKKHLIPAGGKPGDVITAAMPPESEKWFGRVPPDLTLTARERGPEWIYNYLLTFYIDASRPTGVDNLVLKGASMPHVLASLQGYQVLKPADAAAGSHAKPQFDLVQPGSLSPAEYKAFVGDLTNFMTYAAEPGRERRKDIGWKVLLWVLLFWGLAWLLKKEYWKDVN